MDCDMCGKPATAKATIEGAQMAVCASCARHGSNVRQIPQQAKPVKRQPIASNTGPREELVDAVRPDIAKLLRQHRERLQLNQEQFAARIQVRASTYNHWESGAVVPPIDAARKLEHVLGTPLVGKMKVGGGQSVQRDEDARGLQLGDFIKRR